MTRRSARGLTLFFEDDVLAYNWVVLLELETLARVDLVLTGHVHVASVGC